MNSGLQGSKCRTLSLCLSKHRLLGPLAPTRTSLSVLLGTTSCHNTLPSQTCADEKQQPHVTGDVNADRLYTQLSHAPCRGKTVISPFYTRGNRSTKRRSSGLSDARAGQGEAGAPAQLRQIQAALRHWTGSVGPAAWPGRNPGCVQHTPCSFSAHSTHSTSP